MSKWPHRDVKAVGEDRVVVLEPEVEVPVVGAELEHHLVPRGVTAHPGMVCGPGGGCGGCGAVPAGVRGGKRSEGGDLIQPRSLSKSP